MDLLKKIIELLTALVDSTRGTVIQFGLTVDIADGSRRLLSARINRKYLYIQNTGANDVYIGLGTTASANNGKLIKAGTDFTWSAFVPTGDINAVPAALTTTLVAVEG